MNKPLLYVIVPFCSIFIIVGGGMMAFTARKIMVGIQAKRWPQTSGQVVSVESKDTSDSESSSREILVRYAYNVNGLDYESSTIHPAYTSSSFEQAHEGIESLLRPAQKVRVYYDAAKPSRSTLSVGFYSGSLAAFSAGLIFFGAGVGFLLTFWFALAGDWDFARGITVVK